MGGAGQTGGGSGGPAPTLEVAIERLRRGERCEESARVVHDAFHDRLLRYFQRRGRTIEEARDLTQETFLKIYRSIGSLRGDSAFGGWVWTIARNVLLKRVARVPAREESSEDLPAALEPVADEPDPVAVIGRQEHWALVLRAMARLPARQRQCMVLRVVKGLTYDQVASVMSISINSVKAHLHQGRARLKKLLAEAGNGPPEEHP